MGFIKDFREFASKGNVVDLAIGVIIGGAFGKIVTSLVADIIMPAIGAATPNGLKFDDMFIVLKPGKEIPKSNSLEAVQASGANVFAYGHFIQTIVDFLIIALCIFIAIRAATKLRRKQEAAAVPSAPPAPTKTEALLTEIRDALKQRP